MRHMRYLVPLGILLVLLYFLRAGLSLNPREVPSPLIGKPAPAFSLARLDQPAVRIAKEDLRGKVWILNVWASWCVACRQEHPLLVAYSKQAQVPIYGLNYKDEPAAGLKWLADLATPTPLRWRTATDAWASTLASTACPRLSSSTAKA